MTIEQTLKVLEHGRDLSMKAAGYWRGYCADATAACLNQAEALSHAIAIIKAAKAVTDSAVGEGPPDETYFYRVGCETMERLLSLLSPEQ